MDIRVGQCIVIAWTMDILYKQLVEYCCGSLSSSLVNYTTCVPYQISALRFTCSDAIEHWSSGCHNNYLFLSINSFQSNHYYNFSQHISIIQIIAEYIVHYSTKHCELIITTRAQSSTNKLFFPFKLSLSFPYSSFLSLFIIL